MWKVGEILLLNRIKQLCVNNHITITELERVLKFGNGTIHNWDKVDPSVERVKAVAEYFGIGIDYLMSNLTIPSKESRDLAYKLDNYSDEEKNLIRCYMAIIEAKR